MSLWSFEITAQILRPVACLIEHTTVFNEDLWRGNYKGKLRNSATSHPYNAQNITTNLSRKGHFSILAIVHVKERLDLEFTSTSLLSCRIEVLLRRWEKFYTPSRFPDVLNYWRGTLIDYQLMQLHNTGRISWRFFVAPSQLFRLLLQIRLRLLVKAFEAYWATTIIDYGTIYENLNWPAIESSRSFSVCQNP